MKPNQLAGIHLVLTRSIAGTVDPIQDTPKKQQAWRLERSATRATNLAPSNRFVQKVTALQHKVAAHQESPRWPETLN